MKGFFSFILILAVLFLSFCTNSKTQEGEPVNKNLSERKERANRIATLSSLSALPFKIEAPPDNPMSHDKVKLGRLLFFQILDHRRDISNLMAQTRLARARFRSKTTEKVIDNTTMLRHVVHLPQTTKSDRLGASPFRLIGRG